MTPDELIAYAQRQQALQSRPDATVILVLPGKDRSGRRRLLGREGPLGEVVGTRTGGCMVAFKANEIIVALSGGIKV